MYHAMLVVVLFATPEAEPAAPAVPPMVEKMDALKFMVGRWEGEGWTGSRSQRNYFDIRARVESRLGGRVLLIEGIGRAKSPESDGAILHEPLALLAWDEPTSAYTIRTFQADGTFKEAKVEVDGRKLVWGFEVPSFGAVRHTLDFKEDGRWVEIGEFRRKNADQWTRFFDMRLTRSDEPKTRVETAEPAEAGSSVPDP